MGQRLIPASAGTSGEKLDLHQFLQTRVGPMSGWGNSFTGSKAAAGSGPEGTLDAPSLDALMQRIMLDVLQTRVGLT